MKLPLIFVLVTYLVACIVTCSSIEETQPDGPPQNGSVRPQRLFDFANYKRIFNKSYSSLSEALVRQQNFLAKMFRAVVSLVNYKRGTSSYFLSVNKMSDYTEKELEQMRNNQIGEDFRSLKRVAKQVDDTRNLFGGQSLKQVVAEIVEKFPEVRGEFSALKVDLVDGKNQRKKREESRRSSMSLDDLINTGDGRATSSEALRKARSSSQTNKNPNYVEPELMSEGVRDQLEEVSWQDIKSKVEQDRLNRINELFRKYNGQSPNAASKEESLPEPKIKSDSLENEIFFDHRDSNCFWAPRDQGKCASCYAFAFTSILEWTHCVKAGELLAFSEQYMIDCGNYVGLNRCKGGTYLKAARFGHNFGVLLRADYPYTQEANECPYDEDTDLKTTGYIRMDLSKAITVPLDRWEEFIHVAPMFTAISTRGAFHEYGGGVFDGAGCVHYGDHAVVLVGHGREDGQEYWLIRNSHSVAWGEGGYMKISKSSHCIEPEFGFIYGADEKEGLLATVVQNPKHDSEKIKDVSAGT